MKSVQPVFVVDSVEKAAKYYTEKLSFDIVEAAVKTEDSRRFLEYVLLKKGKCFIAFRTAQVNELAELSLLKHSAGRGSGVYIEMKKGIEKYLERCKKKGATIVEELTKQPWGHVTFSVRDPFGILLTFAESVEDIRSNYFCGMGTVEKPANEEEKEKVIADMVSWLKGFGILRRPAKKYAKAWLKRVFK